MIQEKPNLRNVKIAALMVPRFICVEDFPGNPFKVFPRNGHEKAKILSPTKKYPLSFFQDKFGHTFSQFRELYWSELRQKSELPEYIKLKEYPEDRKLPVVFKVVKPSKDLIGSEGHIYIEGGSKFEGFIHYTESGKECRTVRDLDNYLPATEKEFKNQKYQKVPDELLV